MWTLHSSPDSCERTPLRSEIASIRAPGSRREAREAALKALYEVEIAHTVCSEALANVLADSPLEPESAQFATALLEGVTQNVAHLDSQIESLLAKDWKLGRLATIDKLVLRIAAYELFFLPEMPPKVSISQAVVIAKRYGSAESGKFVNGVLGSMLPRSPKASWNSAPGQEGLSEESEMIDELPAEAILEGSMEHEELRKAGPWTIRSQP